MPKPPIKDIKRICEYLERDESKHYTENPTKDHIWHNIVATQRWLHQLKGGKTNGRG